MTFRESSLRFTGVALLVLFVSLPIYGLQGEKALQRRVSWTSVDSQQQGVHIVDIGQQLTERLYFLPDSGAGLIVSSQLDPVSGTLTRLVEDDRTGWWARETTNYGVQAESLSSFFARVGAMSDDDPPVVVRFETSGGASLEIRGSVQAYDEVGRLLSALEREHLIAGVAEGIPRSARDALLFLDVSLADVHEAHVLGEVGGHQDDTLVELLSRIVQQEMGMLRPAPVPMRLDEFRKGLELSKSNEALLRRFASLDTAALRQEIQRF